MSTSSETTVLVKIGGSTLGSDDTSMADIASLQRSGVRVVVVHGGGPEVTAWMAKMGVRAEFTDGLRVTTDAGLDVAVAVLAGLINKRLVAELTAQGSRAVGVSGVDGALMQGTVTRPELGRVAGAIEVDPTTVEGLLAGGHLPVIAPIAVDSSDPSQLLNVNADTAAGAIAVAVEATHLVFLTDVDGIMDSHGRVLKRIPLSSAEELIGSGVVKGGMIPKLQACLNAGVAGVSAHIVNGIGPGALLACMDGTLTGTSVG